MIIMKKLYTTFLLWLLISPLFAFSTITVLTPNGGENWIIGCPSLIQWITSTPTLGVKIELYKNGAYYLTICSQVPAGQSSFTWIPPNSVIPGNNYKVKVTSTASNTGFDFSDANFSINPGTITVVSPNGGEVWQAGSTHLLTWTDNVCGNVKIELWKGGVFNYLISASTPSTGTFTWAIPNNNVIVPGNDYKVKILTLPSNSGTPGLVYDLSDNNFTIGSGSGIVVITPNGGETWIAGCPNVIQWITASMMPVKIELYKNSSYCLTICAQVPAGQNTFTWVPPYTIVTGNDYKVRVSGLTAASPFDFSDNNFSISTGSITVVSPNGGEVWAKGSTHLITWTDNFCDNVRIELWKGGVYYSLIAASVPSTGSYTWAIPNTNTILPGNNYKVKILRSPLPASSVTLFDFSDNNFSIIGTTPDISNETLQKEATEESEIRLYPNPCNDILKVRFPVDPIHPVSAEIISMTGKIISKTPISSATASDAFEISTSEIPGGTYIFAIRSDDGVLFKEVLIITH